MKLRSLRLLLCISFALRLSALPQPAPESPAGTWVGAAAVNGKQVPFRLELRGTGQNIQGVLVNGRERSASSSGSFSNQHLVLHFDYYANTLDATLSDGTLNGTFGGHLPDVSITAHLNAKTPAPSAGAPNISGGWRVGGHGCNGEEDTKNT